MKITGLEWDEIVLLVLLSLLGCTKSSDGEVCASSSLVFDDGICVVFEHDGLSVNRREIIKTSAGDALQAINEHMSIDNVRIRFVDDPMIVVPEEGIGGYNPNQHEVIIAVDNDFGDLDVALLEDLGPLLAHELHHVKRRRSVGYGSTLLQAVVSEGLADHFAIQATGVSPPIWSLAIAGDELQDWVDAASNSWNNATYNHDAWFRGTAANIPRWAGYSIGFKLVGDYLIANPNRFASTLFAEPASSFEP